MSDPVIESQEIKETQEFPSILKMLKGAKKTSRRKGPREWRGRWETVKNGEKLWEIAKNYEKQWETARNYEKKRWETVRNYEKRWETVRNSEKQWEPVRNSKKQWETGRNGEKRWETMRNGGKRWETWSGLVRRTWYILASMLKIYIYWHKCSCHNCDGRRTTDGMWR